MHRGGDVTDPNRYACRVCGTTYVVPSLARCCELEHHRLTGTNPEETR